MHLEIEILSGAGNIFAVIDNSSINKPFDFYRTNSVLIAQSIEFGDLKCEGVIVVNKSDVFNFDVWFFNPDGSSGMMCGNGGRCAVEFASRKISFDNSDNITFKMAGNIYNAKFNNNLIMLELPDYNFIEENVQIDVGDGIITGDYINVGSDHFVFDFETSFLSKLYNFDDTELLTIIKQIREHKYFERGVNVNYYIKTDTPDCFILKTYERGVEAVTGACGTGAVSSAISINLKYRIDFPIQLIPPSNESLLVDRIIQDNKRAKFILTGPAIKIMSFFKEL